jgi:hypothetical protein
MRRALSRSPSATGSSEASVDNRLEMARDADAAFGWLWALLITFASPVADIAIDDENFLTVDADHFLATMRRWRSVPVRAGIKQGQKCLS